MVGWLDCWEGLKTTRKSAELCNCANILSNAKRKDYLSIYCNYCTENYPGLPIQPIKPAC